MKLMNTPIIYLTRKVWQYSKGNRSRVVVFVVFFFIANALWIAEPLLIAEIFNTIQESGVNQDNMWYIIGLLTAFLSITVVFWAFHGPGRYFELQNAFLAKVQYKEYLLSGVMDLSPSWHTDHHSGDTIDKIEKGSNGLKEYAGMSSEVLQILMRCIGSYIALVIFHPPSSYIVAGIILATIVVIISMDKVLVRHYTKLNRLDNTISAKVYDVISNITTVIILRIEKLLLKTIRKKMLKPLKLYEKNVKVQELKWFLVSLGGSSMIVAVMASYIYGAVAGGAVVMMGTLFALYEYTATIQEIFYHFAYRYGDIVRHKASVANAEELAEDFEEAHSIPQVELGRNWKQLIAQNIQFSYHNKDGSDTHLDGVSFTLHKGEKIAFVGESGGGKTTTMKLIRGLYAPQKGTIELDGQELEHGFRSVRDEISLVPQDPEVFNSTIKENITMGVPHTMPVVTRFSKLARFHKVAQRLPKQYASSIVEKGVNLSGGEKQRLALTRGLIASDDKEIVLLDEPTSSVDPKNELEIYENLFKKFEKKTVVSSIHRLHLLSLFDTIYVFSNGKIVDSGSLEELKESSPIFKKLWRRYQNAQKHKS